MSDGDTYGKRYWDDHGRAEYQRRARERALSEKRSESAYGAGRVVHRGHCPNCGPETLFSRLQCVHCGHEFEFSPSVPDPRPPRSACPVADEDGDTPGQ